MKPKMLVFGEDWGRHPSSSQHLALAIRDRVEIVWVNSIGLRQPQACDLLRLASKGLARGQRKGEAAPFEVVAPKLWPLPQSDWVRALNRRILAHQLAAHGPFDYVWCALPSAVEYLDLFPESKVLYYCGDDFSALAGVDHDRVLPLEQRLLQRADWVCCASEALRGQVGGAGAHLVPHGVDLAAFAKPSDRPGDLPRGPVLGFYGALAPWLDYSLLGRIADTLPECNLVLIGPNIACPAALLDRSNVHWLGPRAHHELAAYAQHFQVALLPFNDCAQIRACNPLKMREYLAAGCSVVATDFAAAREQPGVDVAKDQQAFIDMVVRRLSCPARVTDQRWAVAGQGWQQRGEQLLSILQLECGNLQRLHGNSI